MIVDCRDLVKRSADLAHHVDPIVAAQASIMAGVMVPNLSSDLPILSSMSARGVPGNERAFAVSRRSACLADVGSFVLGFIAFPFLAFESANRCKSVPSSEARRKCSIQCSSVL
jgi:hypothetical protein